MDEMKWYEILWEWIRGWSPIMLKKNHLDAMKKKNDLIEFAKKRIGEEYERGYHEGGLESNDAAFQEGRKDGYAEAEHDRNSGG